MATYVTCKNCNTYFYYQTLMMPKVEGFISKKTLCPDCAMFDKSEMSVGDKVISKNNGVGLLRRQINSIHLKGRICTIFRIDDKFIHIKVFPEKKYGWVGYSVPREDFNNMYAKYREK